MKNRIRIVAAAGALLLTAAPVYAQESTEAYEITAEVNVEESEAIQSGQPEQTETGAEKKTNGNAVGEAEQTEKTDAGVTGAAGRGAGRGVAERFGGWHGRFCGTALPDCAGTAVGCGGQSRLDSAAEVRRSKRIGGGCRIFYKQRISEEWKDGCCLCGGSVSGDSGKNL